MKLLNEGQNRKKQLCFLSLIFFRFLLHFKAFTLQSFFRDATLKSTPSSEQCQVESFYRTMKI